MRWSVLTLLSFCAGCLPTPHDVLGKTCAGDDECSPHACRRGACVEATGTQELPERCRSNLSSSDFDNGVGGWFANSSETTVEVQSAVARSATSALRVYGTAATGSRISSRHQTVLASGPGKTYCAAAWIKRGSVRNEFQFIARRYDANNNWQDDTIAGLPSRVTPADDEWFRIVTGVVTSATHSYGVNFRLTNDPPIQVEYFLDDVFFWEDPGGDCNAAIAEGCAP